MGLKRKDGEGLDAPGTADPGHPRRTAMSSGGPYLIAGLGVADRQLLQLTERGRLHPADRKSS